MQTTTKQELYSWRAYYPDGFLDEADAPSGFASVDKTNCTCMALLDEDADPMHMVEIPAGAEPVFFRRRQIEVNLHDGSETPKRSAHCIGWKCGEQSVYLFLLDNGCSLLTTNLQAI